jgi:phage terminase large subunit-like protein
MEVGLQIVVLVLLDPVKGLSRSVFRINMDNHIR